MDPRADTGTYSIFALIFGFLSGVLVSSFHSFSPLVSVFIILVGMAVLVAEKIHKGEAGKEALLFALAIISLGAGMLCYQIKDFHELREPSLTGIVVGEPEERENTTRFVLRSDNAERVMVSTDLYSTVQYGDRVRVEGKLARPGIIADDSGVGRPFDYAAYLSKDDIYWTMSFAEVEVVSAGHGNPVKHALFSLKRSLVGQMKAVLPEPQSSLLAGLVVAGKQAMPRDTLEEFRRAGVVHIVVLSGYNVTIIADFLRKFFESVLMRSRTLVQFGPKLAAGASMLGILLFVIMTGAEATVVRASVMVLVVIAAKLFGRSYSAPRALLVAAFLMIVENPKILVFDPSFQLSFLATLALIYVSPLVESRLGWITPGLGARSMVATTVATQAVVLPYLVWSMGDLSLVSLPANILILLAIPTTMLLGFLAAVSSYLLPAALCLVLAFPAYLLLSWILGVSSFLGNLSFASIAVPSYPFWITLAIYIVITAGLWIRHTHSNVLKNVGMKKIM